MTPLGAGYTITLLTYARKSFTSSTVMSPVVSSGFSRLLLGESMGPGEKAAGCSSGDPGDTGRAGGQLWGHGGHGRDRAVTHCRCHWGSAGPQGCAGRGCHSPVAVLASPSSCCWKGHREKLPPEPVPQGGGTGVLEGQSPQGHIPPEAGGILEPGDLQPAQRLRHIPGTQREALKLRWRN